MPTAGESSTTSSDPPEALGGPHADLVADARAIAHGAIEGVRADRVVSDEALSGAAPAPLETYDALRIAGLGKAAMAVAGMVEARLDGRVDGGLAVVPDGYPDTLPAGLPDPEAVRVVTGGHPLPSRRSVRAGEGLLDEADALGQGDLLLVLVSGGGTALSAAPAGDLLLEDLRDVFRRLLKAGVPIEKANAVRKHLTRFGGGQLARAAAPADVGALVVSDVVGDDLPTIASGPTVADPTTFEDAVRVLYRNDLWRAVPAPVREHLANGADGRRPDTPAAGADCFSGVRTRLVANNATALEAAAAAAEARGYAVRRADAPVTGEARTVGRAHAEAVRRANPEGPVCLLWGGEPTVTVRGSGTGGRNQEVAVAAAQALDGAVRPAVLLSAGTDGIDGPTDAAGGWATPATAARARRQGLDLDGSLERNDSYHALDALGHLLRTGPTHTNVMDVHVGLVRPAAGEAGGSEAAG
jgi:hydroxypyruvate reductase